MHYAVGPIIAVAVVVLLGAFLRWAFGGDSRRPRRPAQPADDGLLTKIATLSRRESALALRAVLSDAGIRSTLRSPGPDRTTILVFPEDAPRARELAATFTPPEN
nr:hypothetical protein [Petropleomorpha daqingensis]